MMVPAISRSLEYYKYMVLTELSTQLWEADPN